MAEVSWGASERKLAFHEWEGMKGRTWGRSCQRAGPSECSRHSPCCSFEIMQRFEINFLRSFSPASSTRGQSQNFASFLAAQKSSTRASIVLWVMKTSPMTSSRLNFSRFHFCCLRDWLHKVQKRTAGSHQDNDPDFSIPNPAYVLIDFFPFSFPFSQQREKKNPFTIFPPLPT